MNQTSKHFQIYSHGLLARLSPFYEKKMVNVNSEMKNSSTVNIINLKDLGVPDTFKHEIQNLVLKNCDLFASKYSELGDAVKLKLDTSDTKPT